MTDFEKKLSLCNDGLALDFKNFAEKRRVRYVWNPISTFLRCYFSIN